MQSNPWSNTQQRWTASGFPFTIFLMAATFLTAILSTLPAALPLLSNFVFVGPADLARPWKMLLYPLLGTPDIFGLLFDIGMTYFFCSSIERAWGTKAFAFFYVTIAIVSALAISLGASVLGGPIFADNLFVVVGAAVVWGFLNAEQQMSLFFLPMRGIHFAGIAVLYIFFIYARTAGWSALPFAMVGPVVAFAWLKYGVTYQIQSWGDGLLPMSRPAPRPGGGGGNSGGSRPKLKLVPDKNKPLDDRFTLSDLNPLRAWKRREERRKFEKLMGGDE